MVLRLIRSHATPTNNDFDHHASCRPHSARGRQGFHMTYALYPAARWMEDYSSTQVVVERKWGVLSAGMSSLISTSIFTIPTMARRIHWPVALVARRSILRLQDFRRLPDTKYLRKTSTARISLVREPVLRWWVLLLQTVCSCIGIL